MAQKEGLSQQEIQALIQQVRQDPRANNNPIYGVNLDELARAQKGGYPRDLYHHELEPVRVLSVREEEAVTKHGYARNYRHREFPCYVFRRNFDLRFAQSEYIEERLIPNEENLAETLKKPLSNIERLTNCSPWVKTVAELPELEKSTNEAPDVTIARLQEQLKMAKEQVPVETKKR